MFQKLERSSTKGYQLIDFGSHWEFHSSLGIFRGDLKQTCTYAVIEHGFALAELELGVLQMNEMFHNGAEFGVFKHFIFTFERLEKDADTVVH